MSDLIRREDVLEIMSKDQWYFIKPREQIERINAIPTIEERKEGKWIHESCSRLIDETDEGRVYTIEKRWHCSRCGFDKGFRMHRPKENYCPNCGAKMERRADE